MDFQLRSDIGFGASHLYASKDSTALTIVDESHHDESKAVIYLSQEQWAELAVFAQHMGAVTPIASNNDKHMTNDEVRAWQDENRARVLEDQLNQVRQYFAGVGYPTTVPTKDYEAVDELVKRGDLLEVYNLSSTPGRLAGITLQGKENNRIYEEGE